jgi:hypothetical protein
MSIFDKIKSAIFGGSAAPGTVSASMSGSAPSSAKPASGAATPASPAAPVSQVDVAAIMDKLAAKSKEKGLDWRRSIVDLMKLLDLDSSLAARRELAKELNYTGSHDSAQLNTWLHKQVMTKLAANGGVVPPELKD